MRGSRTKRTVLGFVTLALVGAGAVRATCKNLIVLIQNVSGQTASLGIVTCQHGSAISRSDFSGTFPATVALKQGTFGGSTCTINVTVGSATAVLQTHQNSCVLEAGDITASVREGPATLQGDVEGSYGQGIPGLVFFTVGS
jgi:hypothetical protein